MLTKQQIELLDTLLMPYPHQQFLREFKKAFESFFANPHNQDQLIVNIRILMGLRNLKTEELSTAAMKNRSYIGRLLRKDFPNFQPNFQTIISIAKALSVKPSVLLLTDLQNEFQSRLNEIE